MAESFSESAIADLVMIGNAINQLLWPQRTRVATPRFSRCRLDLSGVEPSLTKNRDQLINGALVISKVGILGSREHYVDYMVKIVSPTPVETDAPFVNGGSESRIISIILSDDKPAALVG